MRNGRKIAFIAVFLCTLNSSTSQSPNCDKMKQHPELSELVRTWAQKLGVELWHLGDLITRRTMVVESFKSYSVKEENLEQLRQNVHDDVAKMMTDKVDAVKRIMDIAEERAQGQKDDAVDYNNFQFVNAKNLTNSAPNATQGDQESRDAGGQLRYDDSFISADNRYDERYQAMVQPEEMDGYQQDQEQNQEENPKTSEELDGENEVTDDSEKDPQASQLPQTDRSRLPLYKNHNFYNMLVNTNFSAVHIPSNVFERSKDVMTDIMWSEVLDETFRNNYKQDPTLSWQYFGSSTGFLRQFPATIWHQEPIDLYDCRTRSWYTQAASSPKDIVILVDRSGSMTGMRREIARHVVHNILDTMNNNDYVNIFTFSNTTEPLVECFDNKLVQANLANVRILKDGMAEFKTEQIANFSLALVTGFRLLEKYRLEKKGANCNQAIMLVTDGVQYNYKEIFEKYNWENLPFVNVRVFTYLIGREVSDVREVKWMACANRGYYVHLSTYAEVREEVLQYIPVMARPMVLNAGQKPNPTWSPIYADVTDPKLTNWLWVNRERNRQRDRFLEYYGRNKTFLPPDDLDKKFLHQQKYKQDYGEVPTYRLMTSVSLPVYDKRPRAERVANLLGVAGTDIPIEYIERLMVPHRLGVNGYGFLVTNNGYVLTHPDLRPVYQGILKPAYNRVDLTEIEILDDDAEPREFGNGTKFLRYEMVMQKKRNNYTLAVKTHLDDMRRLITGLRHYYYTGIKDTPFSMAIAVPHRYGKYRLEPSLENEIGQLRKTMSPLAQFFTGKWTIHPIWHYCRYSDDRRSFDSPEEEFVHFLKRMGEAGWNWSDCDRKLICKVVNDAKITNWFSQDINTTKEEKGDDFMKRFGITVAFVATHSGLTRWQDFPQGNDANLTDETPHRHFHLIHNKAIDEVWYRRAVEYYFTDQETYVYSVPFDEGNKPSTLLTVTHAIFREEGAMKAPAAAVGYQSRHSAFHERFRIITRSCGDHSCKRTCETEELDCFLLDDNGYVIVSDNLANTGYFFGRIRPDVMSLLVDEGIYKVTRMYDYQGLCPEEQETSNPASLMLTPFDHLSKLLKWCGVTLLYFLRAVSGSDLESMAYPEGEEHDDHVDHESEMETTDQQSFKPNEKEFTQRLLIKKTSPQPCDQEMWLYNLVHYDEWNMSNNGYNKTMTSTRPYIVQKVSHSNMIFLVINNLCPLDDERMTRLPEPVMVDYNMSLACYRVEHDNFTRRYYMSCINRNANESEIKLCGGVAILSPHHLAVFLTMLLHFLIVI